MRSRREIKARTRHDSHPQPCNQNFPCPEQHLPSFSTFSRFDLSLDIQVKLGNGPIFPKDKTHTKEKGVSFLAFFLFFIWSSHSEAQDTTRTFFDHHLLDLLCIRPLPSHPAAHALQATYSSPGRCSVTYIPSDESRPTRAPCKDISRAKTVGPLVGSGSITQCTKRRNTAVRRSIRIASVNQRRRHILRRKGSQHQSRWARISSGDIGVKLSRSMPRARRAGRAWGGTSRSFNSGAMDSSKKRRC